MDPRWWHSRVRDETRLVYPVTITLPVQESEPGASTLHDNYVFPRSTGTTGTTHHPSLPTTSLELHLEEDHWVENELDELLLDLTLSMSLPEWMNKETSKARQKKYEREHTQAWGSFLTEAGFRILNHCVATQRAWPSREELAAAFDTFIATEAHNLSEVKTESRQFRAESSAGFVLDVYDPGYRARKAAAGRKSKRPPTWSAAMLDPYLGQTAEQQAAALHYGTRTIAKIRKAHPYYNRAVAA